MVKYIMSEIQFKTTHTFFGKSRRIVQLKLDNRLLGQIIWKYIATLQEILSFVKRMNVFKILDEYCTAAQVEPCQTTMMEILAKTVNFLRAFNYFL